MWIKKLFRSNYIVVVSFNMSMEQKEIKKELESSNENWNTLYGQIDKLCEHQDTLNTNGEGEVKGIIHHIEHTEQKITKYSEENDWLKNEIKVQKLIIKEFDICKKLKEPKVESSQKKLFTLKN